MCLWKWSISQRATVQIHDVQSVMGLLIFWLLYWVTASWISPSRRTVCSWGGVGDCLKGSPVCCQTASISCRDTACQQALSGAAVVKQQQLLLQIVFPKDPQQVELVVQERFFMLKLLCSANVEHGIDLWRPQCQSMDFVPVVCFVSS